VAAIFFGALTGNASAAPAVPFQIEATYSLAWKGHLVVEERAVGSARAESAPWATPCAAPPAGYTVRSQPPLLPGSAPRYSLYDASGKFVSSCGESPEPPRLPHSLGLEVGPSCGAPGRERVSLEPTLTTIYAAPGGSSSTEVRFEEFRSYAASGNENFGAAVCLYALDLRTQPNRQCAEFLDPSLCAKEYESTREVIQRASMNFVSSPGPRCGAARAAMRGLRSRIKGLRSQGALSPARGQVLKGLLHQYKWKAQPRILGECA
jgi:hypothetical protein